MFKVKIIYRFKKKWDKIVFFFLNMDGRLKKKKATSLFL